MLVAASGVVPSPRHARSGRDSGQKPLCNCQHGGACFDCIICTACFACIIWLRFTTEYPSSYPPRAISLSNPPPHTKPALRTQGGSHPRVWPPTATGPCRPMASTRGLGNRMSAPRDATPCITDDSNDWIKAYHRIPREQRREDHRKGRMKGATGQAELTQPLASAQVELMRPSELAAACDSFTVRCLEETRAGAARQASAQDRARAVGAARSREPPDRAEAARSRVWGTKK